MRFTAAAGRPDSASRAAAASPALRRLLLPVDLHILPAACFKFLSGTFDGSRDA